MRAAEIFAYNKNICGFTHERRVGVDWPDGFGEQPWSFSQPLLTFEALEATKGEMLA